jgi:hypothetical protein
LLPDHAPEAVQDAALVAVQLRVDRSPFFIALGPALTVTVGREALTEIIFDWLARPPGPVQVNT